MGELGIPVRVTATLDGLGVALQAETLLPQQARHGRRGHPVTLLGQLVGPVAQTLQSPRQPDSRREGGTVMRSQESTSPAPQGSPVATLSIVRLSTLVARCRVTAGTSIAHYCHTARKPGLDSRMTISSSRFSQGRPSKVAPWITTPVTKPLRPDLFQLRGSA